MARHFRAGLAAAIVCLTLGSNAAEQHKQVVAYKVPDAPVTGAVPGTTIIHLAIGLPPRDADGLRILANAVSNPKNPQFRHFLTLKQLTDKFGPAAGDYQSLVTWAQTNKLAVESQYSHRLLLTVKGEAADIERALGVKLGYAKRPDGTTFYKPDRAPSLDLDVKVSHISGLDSLFVPRHHGGTQLNGTAYGSPDLRNAYAGSCLGLNGAGESVGIMAYGGYANTDISGYESAVGITNTMACGASVAGSPPCLVNVYQPGYTGPTNTYTAEATADIELAIAMAPGLTQVKVFGADASAGGCAASDAIFSSMLAATDVKQFSSSVGFCPSNFASTIQMMAAAGQSFFVPSGDYGTGYTNGDPNFNTEGNIELTVVGGTMLSMNGTGASYQSEQAWYYSGGGVENYPNIPTTCTPGCTPGATGCPSNCIPPWQQGVANAQNGASSSYRNDPDVAMPAQNVYIYLGGDTSFCGTSAAAPLMAGYMALVNQQQCINSPGGCATGLGYVSPTLYAVGGNAATYAASFHDVVGNSTNTSCPFGGQAAPAVTGYDLATGLGSPTCGLVAQLTCTTCNGTTPTAGTPPSTSCVSFQSDPNNCGSCGNVCSAGNICNAGRCQAGTSNGDTHITTFDGLYYDFQASGEFVLVETNEDFVVQTRQASGAPIWPNAAVNKAVATRMGRTRVALCIEPTRLIVDGDASQLADGKTLSLTGGVRVSRSGNTYVITRRDGETVQTELNPSWINVSVGLGHSAGKVRGLLGNSDGSTADDIALRNGTVLAQPVSFDDLYRSYGESWVVTAKESILCGDRKTEYEIPAKPFYAKDLAPGDYKLAREHCMAAGVKAEALLDACTLDTAVLGDKKAADVFVHEPKPVTVMQIDKRTDH